MSAAFPYGLLLGEVDKHRLIQRHATNHHEAAPLG
jgi:hypothetical protein